MSDRDDKDATFELVEDEDKPESKNAKRLTGDSIVAGPSTARASSPPGDGLRVDDADVDTVAIQPRDLEKERARLLASFKKLCERLKRGEIVSFSRCHTLARGLARD
mgnify:CR=1 FL=1